ncbi:hypothetical protein EJ08DRAFT_676535 [Tothia fuscella]|uniref:RRM domain-containing protein n=1 Tax=Tothia fuscella TaxID=1048955 RepID=A0A9P4NWQ1_9PEZI|nr:hypothetical protein EJ08DRAFT_676535 [Tothia fuscella]
MTTTSPEEAEEFRGKTLSPVSPKPLHFPSPSNIPILDQHTDQAFNVTMMQNMHPDTFPSMAEHTVNSATTQSLPQPEDTELSSKPYLEPYAQLKDSAVGSDEFGNGGQAQAPKQDGGLNSQIYDYTENQSILQGTTLSSNVPSEVATTTSGAEASPGHDETYLPPPPVNTVDPPTSIASQAPMYQSTNFAVELNAAPNLLNDPNPTKANIDALLASFAQPAAQLPSADSTLPPTPSFSNTSNTSPTSALPGHPNLPPKPPAVEKPAHSQYPPGADIRSFHPHSQKDHDSVLHTAQVLPNIATNGLPPPPHAYQTPLSASVPLHSPAYPSYDPRAGSPMSGIDDNQHFDYHTQKKYDDFLAFERQNVAEGQWDKFPTGSRLFIGNLLTEKVSKKDVFRKFHVYGDLAQISLKNAFGFVQFLDAGTCYRAKDAEQGSKLGGKEIHLEISKAQKNTRSTIPANHGAHRERSPDYTRGARGQQQQAPRGVDRYTSGSQVSPRDRDYGRRGRDDYRPGRSPSPPRHRGNDRYSGRARETRSRSPPHGGYNRRRSPVRREYEEELLLPRRAPADVPDIQIIVVDEHLNLQFIQWVEAQIKSRGLRVAVLLLKPSLQEDAVLRRQILEGVLAVVRLRRQHEQTVKIPLQIFDRRAGVDKVQYESYENLDPTIAAELVLRAKTTHAAPPPPARYSVPTNPVTYGIPPTYGQQPPPPMHYPPHPQPQQQPNIANLLQSFGPNAPPAADIARLLQQQQPQQGSAAMSPDLARILGQINGPPQQQSQSPYAPPPSIGVPGFQGQFRGQPPVVPQQQQPVQVQPPAPGPHDISSILAGLTNYKRD